MRTIELIAQFYYKRPYIPPRCRKPKYKAATGEALVEFQVVKPDEAPVAMSHKWGIDEPYTREYRYFAGKFYDRTKLLGGDWFDFEGLQNYLDTGFRTAGVLVNRRGKQVTEEGECIETIQEMLNRYLLIDTTGKGDDC